MYFSWLRRVFEWFSPFLPTNPKPPIEFPQLASDSLLFTCNCDQVALALPVDDPLDDPPAPSPLSSPLGPKQSTETCLVSNSHLFQPMQFHCCSLCVNVRTDTCFADTTDSLEHKRTPSRGWSGLLMSRHRLNLCLSVAAAPWSQTMWRKHLKIDGECGKTGDLLVGEFFWRRFCSLWQIVCVLCVVLCLVLMML